MPTTKSAAKALRQNIKRRKVNLKALDLIRKTQKNLRKLAASGKKGELPKALSEAMSALDKAAKKRIIHPNKASRKKSRLSVMVSKVS